MTGSHLLIDLTVVLAAGLAAGLLARLLRLPTILGYLAVGVAIGPAGLRLVTQPDRLSALADVGVALLMFALGVQLSFRTLARARREVFLGATLQIVLCAALGWAVGGFLGLGTEASVVLGFVLTLSSTAIVVKQLADAGELESHAGRVLLGFVLVQDLAAILMLALLSGFGKLTAGGALELATVVARAGALLAVTLVLAILIIPRVLAIVADLGSKELFLITAVVVCLGSAAGTAAAGFSFALGAFLAGLIISESPYSHQVLAEAMPLRDVLALLFFTLLGTLIDPTILRGSATTVAWLLAAVLVGKGVLTIASAFAAGSDMRTAVRAGSALANIGEFSFVVAGVALALGQIDSHLYSLILTTALLSMLLSPPLSWAGSLLAHRLPAVIAPAESFVAEGTARVLLCGHGRVGRRIGDALAAFNIPFTVIDYDPTRVRALQERGLPAIYGDATALTVLARAGAAQAAYVVLALPDPVDVRTALHHLRQLNPAVRALARVHHDRLIDDAYQAGAEEVVQPELEASLEMMRHTLLSLDCDPTPVQRYIDGIRAGHYRPLAFRPGPDPDDLA